MEHFVDAAKSRPFDSFLGHKGLKEHEAYEAWKKEQDRLQQEVAGSLLSGYLRFILPSWMINIGGRRFFV